MRLRKASLFALVPCLLIWGCGGGSDEPVKKARAAGGSGTKVEAAKGDGAPAAEKKPVATIEPGKVTAKVGEEVTLKGALLNKPKDINRWFFAVSWHYGDKTKNTGRPDPKKTNIETVAKHAWKEKGTYTVTVKFWGNNKVVAESSIQAVIE